MPFTIPEVTRKTWQKDLAAITISAQTREALARAVRKLYGSRIPSPKITEGEFTRIVDEVISIHADGKSYILHWNRKSATLRLVRER